MAPQVINGRTVEGRARPQELLATITPDSYRMAYDAGQNLSLWLEHQDPSDGYNDGLDAFERLLQAGGVVTRSRPEIGLWAPKLSDVDTNENVRNLVPELVARFWRGASYGHGASTRALYASTDEIPGSTIRPFAAALDGRWTSRVAPPIRLADIVALESPIDSNVYKAYYLTTNAAESRMTRVPEGTDIPLAKVTGGDHTITLKKYGRGIESTYEALRRFRIDKIRKWVERLAVQNEMDKVADAINVIVNGDGNTNAATNSQIKTDFDSAATSKTVTLKGWLNWKLKFFPAYRLTHVFGAEADVMKVLLLNIGSSGASVPTYLADMQAEAGYANVLRDGVTYGVTADGPADKLVGFDASAALEHVIEIGSEINEMERFARRQTETLLMSVVEGFAIFDATANRTLELES